MSMRTPSFSARRDGFTLVEVLVSSAVLAIVLAVMFAALSTSLSLWRNTDNKIVADREARAVELMLVRDLGNVVMLPSTNFWPRVVVRGGEEYLKFLTVVPPDAQSAGGTEAGNVCYVEYAVVAATNGPGREVRRLLWPGRRTYDEVLLTGAFPTAPDAAEFQSLGLHLLPSNNMAARGLGPLVNEANNTNFILIGTNMLPFSGTPSLSNYPAIVEVNFSVADPDVLANSNALGSSSFILRNAGLYSFRAPLPKPSTP